MDVMGYHMIPISVTIREDIRRQIVVLARRPRARSSAFTPQRPTDWRPTTVVNPETGEDFTLSAAWRFIAEYADRGHDIQVVPLRKPPGATGYVMRITLETNRPRLDVKVELRSGRILVSIIQSTDVSL